MTVGGSLAALSSVLVFFVSLVSAGIMFYSLDIGRVSKAFGIAGYDVRGIVLAVSSTLVILSLIGYFLGVRARLYSRRAALASALLHAGFCAFVLTMILRQPRILTAPYFFPDSLVLSVAVLSPVASVLCLMGYLQDKRVND